MRITKFKFEDKSLEWSLEELQLNKFTLLVGASGVGKTLILRAIMNLRQIAEGSSLNGISWVIEFETLDKKKYVWAGEFENKGFSIFSEYIDEDEEKLRNKPKILFEKLTLDDDVIVDRTSDKIMFKGEPTIKLSQQESVLHLLKEEDLVKSASMGFKRLLFSDQTNSVNTGRSFSLNFFLFNNNKISKKYNTLQEIQESELDTPIKLFLLSKVDKKAFGIIKQRFSNIFPQVEDLKIAPLDNNKELPDFFKDRPFIQIKEKNVKNWISQNRISSGMFRTLIQLSELYLCAEGTIFLIDEFENSLGINCINEITSDILASKRQLQFVITSHHPYIIDTIEFSNWKLVTRTAGVIKTHNIEEFNIGKSKHSAFMQLLQLEEYQTGQEQL